MTSDAERFLVFAAMRNEGAFVVEWVTWYRALGFRILIAHNDCTDHSPQLFAALERAGWIAAVEHKPAPGVHPKRSAYLALQDHPLHQTADWGLVCDVDEFLVLHAGDGTITGYLDRIGRAHHGVAFHWRCFGTSGYQTWSDRLQHRQFTFGPQPRSRLNVSFKTMARLPRLFNRHSDHAPFRYRGTGWGEGEAFFVDGAGKRLDAFGDLSTALRRTPRAEISHAKAQMNHYILRSRESFDLKKGIPSASAGVDRYTDAFFEERDVNSHRDLSALADQARFDALHAEAMALPEVRRMHHLCCADYAVRLAALRGLPPEADARWRHHQAEAQKS